MSNRHFSRRYQSVEEPMDDSSDNSNQTWLQDSLDSMQLKRSEMNELIMEYLVHEGFREAAERFREEAGIEPRNLKLQPSTSNLIKIESTTNETSKPPNQNNTIGSKNNSSSSNSNNNNGIKRDPEAQSSAGNHEGGDNISDHWSGKAETPEMLDKRIEVRHMIEEGEILKALSLINLYYPELLDNRNVIQPTNLYFKLQQQHLIELIRQQKINDVLSYVHDQLSVDELDRTEMERTLALLAYENPTKSPYASLLYPSHRLQLASEVNDIVLQETTGNVEASKPRLVTLIKLLYWTQSELERKKIKFPKMTDLVEGTVSEPMCQP